MTIADWRRRIDELDEKLVALLNERATAAKEIGRLKKREGTAIFEPNREKEIFENLCRVNRGPLPDRDLAQVYERIIDVMRKIQWEQVDGAKSVVAPGHTEIESGTEE